MIKYLKRTILGLACSIAFIQNHVAQNTINKIQYWFDNDHKNSVYKTITDTESNYYHTDSIDISNLKKGLHTINYRFQDDSGNWCSTISRFFQVLPKDTLSINSMVEYEYWIDNQRANKVSKKYIGSNEFILVEDIDVNQLKNGLHIFNYRVKDITGQWSSVYSSFFQLLDTSNSTSSNITGYEYWFDYNTLSKYYKSVSPVMSFTLDHDMDVSGLKNGLHTLHIRFKNRDGDWSSVLSRFFQKSKQETIFSAGIIGCEYWFDQNYQNKSYFNIEPDSSFSLADSIASNKLKYGLHTIQFRFKDYNGKWSNVISRFFRQLKKPAIDSNNKIMGYRYWIDTTQYKTIYFGDSLSGNHIIMNQDIDMKLFSEGKHTVAIQLLDVNSIWSAPLIDTVYKKRFPYVSFSTANNALCQKSEAIIIFDTADITSLEWNYGDNTVDTGFTPSHQYDTAGLFSVSVSAYDKVTDSLYSFVKNDMFMVYPIHETEIAGKICPGDSFFFHNKYYHVDGLYLIDTINQFGCDSVIRLSLSVFPEPSTPVVIKNQDTLISDASTGNQWYRNEASIPEANNQFFIYNKDGYYYVMVTDTNGCISDKSNTIEIGLNNMNNTFTKASIYPNPVVNYLNINFRESHGLSIKIMDVNGQILLQTYLKKPGCIDMTGYTRGIYFLQIGTAIDKKTIKILKE
jgi:hypothetical protein